MLQELRFRLAGKLLTMEEKDDIRVSMAAVLHTDIEGQGKSESDLRRMIDRKRTAERFSQEAL